MAQETQYWSFRYILGTVYSLKTDASLISPVSPFHQHLRPELLFHTAQGWRTDGSGLDHVANGESLDGLVFGAASGAVGATNGLDVPTALLVTTAVNEQPPSAFLPPSLTPPPAEANSVLSTLREILPSILLLWPRPS